jgi:hypothetical protein
MLPAAALPHPADPMFISLGATIGGLSGRTIARMLGYDADRRMHWTVEGGYVGTVIALGAYMAANALAKGGP